MDYVHPTEVVAEALRTGEKKAGLSIRDIMIRGFLSGVFLGYATSLAQLIVAQGLPPIVGAVAFPVGFVILVLLGLELVTGNFALLPPALAAGRVSFSRLFRNWGWVYLANLLGSVFYAILFSVSATAFGTTEAGPIGEQVRLVAQRKTLAYLAIGLDGWNTAFVRGILCNWMVTLGTVLAFVSRSTTGKIAAMWLPITIFFALGYEHSVVNMYAIPAGILMGAPISISDWWLWNQIPVTLGNIIGGAVFTGLALYTTHGPIPAAEKE